MGFGQGHIGQPLGFKKGFGSGGGFSPSTLETFYQRVINDGGTFESVSEYDAIISELSSFDSSWLLTPNAYKTSKIYSAIPTDGSGDLTFTREYTARRKAYSELEKVSHNIPRLSYLGDTVPNLLLEPQRTQLLPESYRFLEAAWIVNRMSVTREVTGSIDLNEVDNVVEIATNYIAVTCTASDKVQIFDKSNPASLSFVSSIITSDGPIGIAVTSDSNYIIVTCYLDDVVEIYDISNIASPSLTATITSGVGGFTFTSPWNITLSPNDQTLFILFSNGVESADISTIATPTYLDTISDGGSVELSTPLEAVYDTVNSMLWVAAYSGNTIEGINVSNPSAMTHVSKITHANLTQVHSVVKKGNYLMTASRSGAAFCVINVTTPASPTLSASITGLGGCVDVKYSGNTAVVCGYDNRELIFIDITTITAPSIIDYFYDGEGTANLYLPDQSYISSDGYIYVTARGDNTLNVVKLSDASFVSQVNTNDYYKLLETATSGTHGIREELTKAASSLSYVLAVRAKAGLGRDWICLQADDVTNGAGKFFNLTTGALGNDRTVGAGFTIDGSYMASDGDGGYLCYIKVTSTTSTTLRFVLFTSTDGATLTYAGDITKGFYLKEANLIQSNSPFSNSYVPNAAISQGSEIRLADTISALTSFTSKIGQTEGTIYLDLKTWADSVSKVFSLSDGTTNNEIKIMFHSDNKIYVVVTTGGVSQASIANASFASDTQYKVAVTYQSNKVALFVNGTKIGEDLAVTVPACSQLRFTDGGGLNPLYGNIRVATIGQTAISDAEAQTLTT